MPLSEIESQIRQYLVDELGAEKDIGVDELLFSAGVLDSFDIVQVLDYVNTQFDVQISPLDVNLDNFDSISRMVELVARQSTT
jgi:acyl carrier protein